MLKQGQIAHLDQNSANASEDNLAYLCLDHHDQYDSSTKQSKNFTIDEVKHFRNELYISVRAAFSNPVAFGQAIFGQLNIVGHYIRSGEFESAELTIKRLDDGRYHVSGLALWGTSREFGPNIGELDFVAELQSDILLHAEPFSGRAYAVVIRFSNGRIAVTEVNWQGMFGMNVNFNGDYDLAT